MLGSSLERILREVGDGDVVLDVGGWIKPFARADWVMDIMPYETRGGLGREGPGEDRFSADTWIRRDICDREPYPFEGRQIDFAICSHTLEDVRDPVWVCSELVRVAKAGYIEVPSRLEEQSWGVQGPWVGWGHHRWLVDVADGRIEFVMKPHLLHARQSDHFPAGFDESLSEGQRVQTLWWRGGFEYGERVMTSADELDPYLADFVKRHKERFDEPAVPRRSGLGRLLRRAVGS
jgi:hypothetical protein